MSEGVATGEEKIPISKRKELTAPLYSPHDHNSHTMRRLTTENGTVVGVNATEILPNITGTFNNMNMTVDGNNSTSGLRGNSTGRRLCGGAHCSAFSGHYWHQYACSSCACTGHACDQNMYQSWCPSCS